MSAADESKKYSKVPADGQSNPPPEDGKIGTVPVTTQEQLDAYRKEDGHDKATLHPYKK